MSLSEAFPRELSFAFFLPDTCMSEPELLVFILRHPLGIYLISNEFDLRVCCNTGRPAQLLPSLPEPRSRFYSPDL